METKRLVIVRSSIQPFSTARFGAGFFHLRWAFSVHTPIYTAAKQKWQRPIKKYPEYFYDFAFLQFAKNWKIYKFNYGSSLGTSKWKFNESDEKIAKEYMKSSWGGNGGMTGILRRISLDEPSLAVLTSPMMKQTDRCHPLEVRPFSYRENARIQTFPDEWKFCGSLAEKYKQIGNAVPVKLAEAIGIEIYKCLEMLND